MTPPPGRQCVTSIFLRKNGSVALKKRSTLSRSPARRGSHTRVERWEGNGPREMNAEELDNLLDGLPAAVEWAPLSAYQPGGANLRERPPPDSFPASKPPRFAHRFGVDGQPASAAAARSASETIARCLTSVPDQVPSISDAEWTRALEAAVRFRGESGVAFRSKSLFVDLSTGMRVRCHHWCVCASARPRLRSAQTLA